MSTFPNRLDESSIKRFSTTRWLGRYCLEAPGLGLRDAALILSALDALRGEHGDAGAQALLVLFDAGGRDDLAAVLGRWSARRSG